MGRTRLTPAPSSFPCFSSPFVCLLLVLLFLKFFLVLVLFPTVLSSSSFLALPLLLLPSGWSSSESMRGFEQHVGTSAKSNGDTLNGQPCPDLLNQAVVARDNPLNLISCFLVLYILLFPPGIAEGPWRDWPRVGLHAILKLRPRITWKDLAEIGSWEGCNTSRFQMLLPSPLEEDISSHWLKRI